MINPISKGRTWAAAALVSTSLLAAACGSSASSSVSPGSSGASGDGGTTPSAVSTLLPDSVAKAGTLTIATYAQLPPNNFTGPDGKIMGVSIDMGDALANVLGVKTKWVNTPFASLIPGLQAGRYDIAMSGITDTDEREKQVDFVDFIQSGQVFIVPKGNPGGITSRESLCGKTLSLVKGTISVDIAQAASTKCTDAGKPAANILQFPTAADALLQLQNGRAQANIANLGKAAYQADQSKGALEVAGDPFDPSYDAVAVPKGDKEMIAALQYAFGQIISDGTYGKILEKWNVQKSAVDEVTVNGADKLANTPG